MDRLYAGAPEDFIGARAQLARQARSDGDTATAAEIAALRRPTASAALLNALARAEPRAVTALGAVGDELREAQQRGDGEAIRALGRKRRQVIATAMASVATIAADRGLSQSASVRAEVEASLAAAILDPASAEQLAAGALTGALHEVGFGDWSPAAAVSTGTTRTSGTTGTTAPRPALRAVPDLPTRAAVTAPSRAEQKAERERMAQERDTRRQAMALERAEAATAALAQAQARSAAAQQRVTEIQGQIDHLRGELGEATADARLAHEAERKAGRDASAAMRRLTPGGT
ncbi:MAG: hypothetical protein JWN20_2715 [Jatrophihabitantaceae bacterium]|nr:hypothetical protein [Jatrophihabitantaceae bacterium]